MLLPPLVGALIWIVVAWTAGQGRTEPQPWLPRSLAGRLALAAMALILVVLVAPSPLPVAIPVGAVLLVPALLARFRYRDPGILVVVPLVFGAWFVVFPTVYLLLGGSA